MRILFLDFDGVLHAAVGPASAMKRFVWAPVLEKILRPYPGVSAVVHASARDHTDIETIATQLGSLGRRVVDAAPKSLGRWEAICLWLKGHPEVTDYRILDDEPREYPAHLTELIVCDSRTGISGLAAQEQLMHWLGAESVRKT